MSVKKERVGLSPVCPADPRRVRDYTKGAKSSSTAAARLTFNGS